MKFGIIAQGGKLACGDMYGNLISRMLGYQYWVSYGWRQVSLGVAVSRLEALYITSRTVAS